MSAEPPVQVDAAEIVNVGAEPMVHAAYAWLVFAVTCGVLIGFGLVTYAVLSGEAGRGIDAATKGSVIQTWNNLTVGAVAVWTTSKIVDRVMAKK